MKIFISFLTAIFYALIVVFFLLIGFFIYYNYLSLEVPCLEEVAENYCENEGFPFDRIVWSNLRWHFYCKENPREINSIKDYNFLKEELEGCKKE